jgi:hypothetical protein
MYNNFFSLSSSSTATIIQNINSQYKTLNCKVICDTSSISTASKYNNFKGQIDSKNYVNIFKYSVNVTIYKAFIDDNEYAYGIFIFLPSCSVPLLREAKKIKLFLLIFFGYELVLLLLACVLSFLYIPLFNPEEWKGRRGPLGENKGMKSLLCLASGVFSKAIKLEVFYG